MWSLHVIRYGYGRTWCKKTDDKKEKNTWRVPRVPDIILIVKWKLLWLVALREQVILQPCTNTTPTIPELRKNHPNYLLTTANNRPHYPGTLFASSINDKNDRGHIQKLFHHNHPLFHSIGSCKSLCPPILSSFKIQISIHRSSWQLFLRWVRGSKLFISRQCTE